MSKLVKVLAFIVLVAVLTVGGYFLYFNYFYAFDPTDVSDSDIDINDQPVEVKEETVVQPEEAIAEEPEIDPLRVAPEVLDLEPFSNAFFKFNYPSKFKVANERSGGVDLTTDGKFTVAVVDYYPNEANLGIREFLSSTPNMVNYFETDEGARMNYAFALDAYKWKDFPGYVIKDVYVFSVDKGIIIFAAWDSKDEIAKYVIPSFNQ